MSRIRLFVVASAFVWADVELQHSHGDTATTFQDSDKRSLLLYRSDCRWTAHASGWIRRKI